MHFKNFVATVAIISLISSCKKEDNKQGNTKETRSDLLVGKWKCTHSGENPDALIPTEERYSYLDEYKPNGQGTSMFFGDSSVESFTWMIPADETYLRQIREYDGEPDTVYLEFYSFEKNRFIFKDTSFGMVMYGAFARQ